MAKTKTKKVDPRLGERVEQVREHHGYSRNELAQMVGITYQSIWNIETSRTSPSFDTVRLIAQALETDPTSLID